MTFNLEIPARSLSCQAVLENLPQLCYPVALINLQAEVQERRLAIMPTFCRTVKPVGLGPDESNPHWTHLQKGSEMAIITISRGSYYRGKEVAEKLAQKLLPMPALLPLEI